MKNNVLQIKNTAIVSCVNPVFIMKIHKPIIAVIDFFTNFNGLYFQHKKEKRHFIHKSHWIHFTSGFIEWSTKLIGGRKRKYAKNIIQPRKKSSMKWHIYPWLTSSQSIKTFKKLDFISFFKTHYTLCALYWSERFKGRITSKFLHIVWHRTEKLRRTYSSHQPSPSPLWVK